MTNITKSVLRRPVTTLLLVLTVLFFGVVSLTNTSLELTPDVSLPMFVITTTYAGASPKDINELVTKPIEEQCTTLSDVDTITSESYENYGLTMIQYDYGTDMDNAYSELRKKLDVAKSKLPEDAGEPLIIEMNINQLSAMYICLNNQAINNIYNYAQSDIVPEFEKLGPVASVTLSGGNKEYISIELIPERISQYRLDITTVAGLVGAASYSMPAGTALLGTTDMTISSGVTYDEVEALKRIPITAGGGNILYLEDIAVVQRRQSKSSSVGRYNGIDTVLLQIERNQQYTAVDVSNVCKETMEELKAKDPNLDFIIVEDTADQIRDSLKTMLETMVVAIIISTIILILFYGDLKASLIVATSIPLALLVGFILIWGAGYTMNVVTLGSLVIAIGMMVDNSIVVLESCFRVMEENEDHSFKGYIHAAVRGADIVGESILGSTLTTIVVFLPLAFTEGLSNQFFKPMSYTIVFCMLASLLSAISIVPLCYVFYRPVEKEKAPAYHAVRLMQNGYRKLMKKLLNKKKLVVTVTLLLFAGAIGLATTFDLSLFPEMDQGTVAIAVTMKPNTTVEHQAEIIKKIEDIISEDPDLESTMCMSGTINAYLKSDRKKTTKETIAKWKKELQAVSDCDLSLSSYSYTSMLTVGGGFSVMLENASYDKLKESAGIIKESLKQDDRVTGVSSTVDNASPIIQIDIDPVAASAEGFVPAQVSQSLYVIMTGVEADTMEVNGEEYSVRVEYPEEEYNEISKVEDITLTSSMGNTVYLRDIARVSFEDSPNAIERTNKLYTCTISANYTDKAGLTTSSDLKEQYVIPNLTGGTNIVESSINKMLTSEFNGLYVAIAVSVFLIFVVMAAQFESAKFSIMVMTTLPFAMIGSFGLLWIFNIPLTAPALVGFVMLVGTVVNNGILYVDTVNQFRRGDYDGAKKDENGNPIGMELNEALIEAGAIRLRPILMTTLTTVLSMIPMCAAGKGSGVLMQGLAMVETGGLITSTVMALIVLPIYYDIMNRGKGVRENYAELN